MLAFLALGVTAGPLAAEIRQTARIARIGYLTSKSAGSALVSDAFRKGLLDLGYVEGSNLVIESRNAEGDSGRFPVLAAELVALNVDVIVAVITPATQAAMRATTTIPIVFTSALDPVRDGLVSSLARPGGNVTGLCNVNAELVGKRLELLKQTLPGIDRVAILTQPGGLGERTERYFAESAENAARTLGMQLLFVDVRGPQDFDRAFSDMRRAHAAALMVFGGAMLFGERRRLADLAEKYRLPLVSAFRDYVEAGGLLSYGPNEADLSGRAAGYVDRILKGARPGDLPVEQPAKFDLAINLKTAKSLGITIPQSLLQRASEVIR